MLLISLDIETTGLDPRNDKIIEIGAALVNMETREIEKKFETFIQPGVPIPHMVINLTGITDEDLKNAPNLKDIAEDLKNFIGDRPIMGHNINFDLSFLEENGISLSNTRLDSMDIAHIAIANADSYSLEIVAEKLGVKEHGKHRALSDVENNIEIMFKLLDIYFAQKIDITEILKKSEWSWKEIFTNFKPHETTQINPLSITHQPLPITHYPLPTSPSLTELPRYATEQLIPESPEIRTIIATPNFLLHTLLEPSQYLDNDLFQKLLGKPTLTSDETVFALKILPSLQLQLPLQLPLPRPSLPQNLKNLWFEYCHSNYPENFIEKLSKEKLVILDHHTLAQLAKNNPNFITGTHLIIDSADEFYANVQKPFIYSERRFLNSSLPQEIKDRLVMLFGYIGILYEKHGAQFDLELQDQHFSTLEWQKTADLIDKIATNLEENCEEARMLKYLAKAKDAHGNTRIEIAVTATGSPLIKITPLNIGDFLVEKLWPLPSKLNLVSTAVTYQGEKNQGEYLKNLLNLPLNIQIDIQDDKKIQAETYELKSEADLGKYIMEIEKPAFVLVNSQRTALQLHQQLALKLKEKGITILAQSASGGMGKIKIRGTQNPQNTVTIGTYDFWKYISLDTQYQILNTLIIFKAPFPHPNSIPFTPPSNFNSFKEYALPTTMLKIKKIAKTAQKVISFDQRIKI